MYNSNVKQSDLKDFFRAQFVSFRCQKYVKVFKKRVHEKGGGNNFTLSPEKVHQVAIFYTTSGKSNHNKNACVRTLSISKLLYIRCSGKDAVTLVLSLSTWNFKKRDFYTFSLSKSF